jgi:hypothetical protein
MSNKTSLQERRLSVVGVPALIHATKRFTTERTKSVLEKDVKHAVKEIIKGMAPNTHLFWPVQTGFGVADLDCIVSINGFALRIETKIHPKKPTPRQRITTNDLTAAGVPVLWIDQNNLDDLAVVIDLLLVGKQGDALEVSAESREEFDGRAHA